jgi:phytoene dehydrogenase-like protein
MSAVRYDAIIIGGGHNGLVTAAYLARAGKRTVVLERRPMVGGCSVTEPLWPGYRVSTAAYLSSLLQEKVVRELDLARHGYRVTPKDPPFFSPFPDGRYLFTFADPARTHQQLAKFSRRDAEALPRYEAHLERMVRVVEALLLEVPIAMPPASLGEWAEFAKTAGRLRKLGADDIGALVKIFTMSAADFLDEWFESPQVKVTLATDGVIGANGGPRSAGTAYVLLHHVMGGVEGRRGVWGFVQGGMGAVSEALASAAREAGAEIRVNTGVRVIVAAGGRAQGVVLDNGDELPAPLVVSNCDPKVTFQQLMDPRLLPEDFARAIGNYRSEGTSCKINLALNGLPEFTCLPGAPGPQHQATMHICESIDYVERAWDDAKYGRPSAKPMLEMTVPTLYDPSLAPAGKHVMGIFLQYAPYTLREGNWDDLRAGFAARVYEVIEQYAHGFRALIEHEQVLTPLDLERRFGISGGNIFHGEMALDQMFALRPVAGWGRYATPLAGLYLCGAGTHPGGGVMGAAGHNAAKAILSRH